MDLQNLVNEYINNQLLKVDNLSTELNGITANKDFTCVELTKSQKYLINTFQQATTISF